MLINLKKKITLTIVSFAAVVMFQVNFAQAQKGFTLHGHLKGYPDSVRVLINKVFDDHEIDRENEHTFYLINGRFTFKGAVEKSTLFFIRMMPKALDAYDPTMEYMHIWVENAQMTLQGKKGELEFAEVTGSPIHDQYEEYLNITRKEKLRNIEINDSIFNVKGLSDKTLRRLKDEYNESWNLFQNADLDFIKAHPGSYISSWKLAFYTKFLPELLPKNKAQALYNPLTDDLKNNIYGKQVKNYIDNVAVNVKLKIGDEPYEFVLPDSAGNSLSLASLKGKVILIDFWASSCGPCRKEHKNYLKAYTDYREKGFEILSVSQDTKRKPWVKAMKQDNMVWKSVLDATREVSNYKYLVSAIPMNYLINAEGKIVAQDLKGEQLALKLQEILGN